MLFRYVLRAGRSIGAGTAFGKSFGAGALGVKSVGLIASCAALLAGASAIAHAQTLAAAERQAVVAATPPVPAEGSALGGTQARTRFVIGLDKTAQFQVFSLSNPNRVIVELPDVKVQLPAIPEGAASVGLVKAFRGGEAGSGRNRVVIDVTQPVVVESARIEKTRDGKGAKLALDIVPVDAVKKQMKQPFALGAAGVQPPLPKPAMSPAKRAAKAFRPIIVVDPGHGGHDSGAKKNGAVEKEVVLAFSKVLRDKLEASGHYRVIMTRESDVFVELDERRAFAERHNANLFIAVHADYASSRARGATIFSLRDRVADELKRSAKGHVPSSILSEKELKAAKETGDVSAVQSILTDLASAEVEATKERTSVFSRSLIEYMGAETEMRDNPDQQAAFRVLKTAQFPSVLIELAYVTNKQDAENLKSEEWRDKVSDAILTAVENYFSHQVARLPM